MGEAPGLPQPAGNRVSSRTGTTAARLAALPGKLAQYRERWIPGLWGYSLSGPWQPGYCRQPVPRGPQNAAPKPNIIVIMGDDVGWSNIGAYSQGPMYDTTPNLDKLAGGGTRFTNYFAEPSCTAGRADVVTGELPIRTGLTTVRQAGATIGVPDQAPPSPRRSRRCATKPGSSARTTLAT
jgi:sulfatase-like protein